MPAGYSATPLIKKLGYKEGFRALTIEAPENYAELLGTLPDRVEWVSGGDKEIDLIHLFAASRSNFETRLPECRALIKPGGMIWVSWPKKASKVPTDMNEDAIREFALANGLVDVKVCAVDDVWSGLKLVIPVALR